VADTLTLRQINRATLARQMLLERQRVPPLAVIERLVGMQAQWPRPPFVGLWTRLDAFDRQELVRLLEQRKAVRATLLRGTLHLTTSQDFLTFRPVIQPGLDAGLRSLLRDRLDGLDLPRLIARARAFFDERPRSFEDLRDEFLRLDPKADERAMGYAVRMLLPLVQVPDADAAWGFPARAAFAPAETWLRRRIRPTPAAPDVLVTRYLEAYGPATPADIQAWSGLPKPSVREAVERLRPRLTTLIDERRRELLDLPGAPRPPGDTPAPVRLIPEYDNLITARADERFVSRTDRPRVFLSALRVAPTVLVDGFVKATWSMKAGRKGVTVTVESFGPLAAPVRQEIAAEAEALARFSDPGARSDVTFRKV
jgi:DNA glycosylase AlkZ-like